MDMDDRFANGTYIKDAASFPPMWDAKAAAFRNGARAKLDIPYGARTREKLDLFLPVGLPKGLMVFIHGGYWMAFDKSTWSHLAAGAVAQGWAVAVPSYDLCPNVRISQITAQMQAAVAHAATLVYGPIRLTGHSAGGHLVARLAGMDWGGRLQKVVPISAVTDLVPLMQTRMNTRLQLDLAEAEAESPQNSPKPDVPVTMWVGGDERPVFIEQSQDLAAKWHCGLHIAQGRHHFDVIAPLADPDSDLLRELLS